jgi:hypothetical protein
MFKCLKLRHSEKAKTIAKNLPLVLTLLSQSKWEIFSNFVAFLENPNFKGNFDILFEMEEGRADKTWAVFFKIKGFNN